MEPCANCGRSCSPDAEALAKQHPHYKMYCGICGAHRNKPILVTNWDKVMKARRGQRLAAIRLALIGLVDEKDLDLASEHALLKENEKWKDVEPAGL